MATIVMCMCWNHHVSSLGGYDNNEQQIVNTMFMVSEGLND
jgi:hypothetical protein